MVEKEKEVALKSLMIWEKLWGNGLIICPQGSWMWKSLWPGSKEVLFLCNAIQWWDRAILSKDVGRPKSVNMLKFWVDKSMSGYCILAGFLQHLLDLPSSFTRVQSCSLPVTVKMWGSKEEYPSLRFTRIWQKEDSVPIYFNYFPMMNAYSFQNEM